MISILGNCLTARGHEEVDQNYQNLPFPTPRCKTVAEIGNPRLASKFSKISQIRFCLYLDLAGDLQEIPNAIFSPPFDPAFSQGFSKHFELTNSPP